MDPRPARLPPLRVSSGWRTEVSDCRRRVRRLLWPRMRPLLASIALLAAVARAPPRPTSASSGCGRSGTTPTRSRASTSTTRAASWSANGPSCAASPTSGRASTSSTRVENHGAAGARGDPRRPRDHPGRDGDARSSPSRPQVKAGSWLFEIGLTGKDWPAEHVEPVAWEVELQSADGTVLAKKASFLWEKPGR